MAAAGSRLVARRILVAEAGAFAGVALILWLNELIDLPHRLLGAAATPVNWRESLAETLVIGLVAVGVCRATARLLARVRTLEGILPICAGCKKIRDEQGLWQPVEAYVTDRSGAVFSHGLCPACLREYFPEDAAAVADDGGGGGEPGG